MGLLLESPLGLDGQFGGHGGLLLLLLRFIVVNCGSWRAAVVSVVVDCEFRRCMGGERVGVVAAERCAVCGGL